MRFLTIRNANKPDTSPIRAVLADTFFLRLRGLMFTSQLPENEGLLIVEPAESVVSTSIHMLFMNYDITAVWLDSANRVVDVQLAKRWRLAYAPEAAAKSVLELHAGRIEDYSPGDQLTIENA